MFVAEKVLLLLVISLTGYCPACGAFDLGLAVSVPLPTYCNGNIRITMVSEPFNVIL